MARALNRSDLLGTTIIVLLSITYAGRVFRWSSRPCAPVDEDGVSLPHDGGLDPMELQESLSGVGGTADLLSLPFEVFFPPSFSVAAHTTLGHDLAAASGEVSIWVEGTAWEDRQVVLEGRVSEPEYGDVDEPVSFSLTSAPWEDSSLTIPSTARVTPTTWSSAVNAALGLYYPKVLGAPGVHGGGISPGSPGLYVRFEALSKYILVAGHEVSATSVTLQDPDGAQEVFAVVHVRDGLGRLVAVVDIYGALTVNPLLQDGDWWVIWDQGGGGMRDGTRTGTLSGAGDVLVHFLRLSSLAVDLGRWAAVAPHLNAYRLAAYLDDPSSNWQWVLENVLPLLPVSVRGGSAGSFPVLWRYQATSADAVEHLVAGPGFLRVSPVSTGPAAKVINEIRMEYARDPQSGTAQRWRILRGDADLDSDEEVASYHATLSLRRYGVHAVVIESDVVSDDQTAGMVCAWIAAASAFPPRLVSYEGDQSYGWIELGAVVTLTDADIALDAQVCLVSDRERMDDGSIVLTFWILESMPRDRRL